MTSMKTGVPSSASPVPGIVRVAIHLPGPVPTDLIAELEALDPSPREAIERVRQLPGPTPSGR
jgi:hypothetical protein